VVNLKTAKQISVTIPPNVLVRADRVFVDAWIKLISPTIQLYVLVTEASYSSILRETLRWSGRNKPAFVRKIPFALGAFVGKLNVDKLG